MNLIKFENSSALDIALVNHVAERLSESINECGSASLVVSGGRTPKGFFHLLSQHSLDWRNVTVTLADERWVDPSHEASNEKLVRENLLINKAAKASFVSLKSAALTALKGESCIDKALSTMGRFTVVILGMGDDGHTASLFPGSDTLSDGLDLNSKKNCLSVTPLDAPHERMSMTLPKLLDSQEIIIHLCGANKMVVLERALAGQDRNELPVRSVLHQTEIPVSIYWSL
ncbi:MAG: 6-phosphogluconolactonase [Porticoccaceae bacterium]|nr:6-phosphogluconolactonase [Porticoccaceae bacterium]MDG1474454.1 6-phosphogluconolactonase [Porticoccaceae bacterium]